MPRPGYKQINAILTTEQHAAFTEAVPSKQRSAFIRAAIGDALRKRGHPWPDNMAGWGGVREKKTYTLDELLDDVTDDNIHGESDL